MLTPNGLEKLETGEQTTIQWLSAGLTTDQTVALVNAGNGGTVDNWLGNKYQIEGSSTGSFSSAVDLTGVMDPAPEEVYQRYSSASSGIGNRLVYDLPVANGSYDVRLHFAEPSTTTVGNRVFDILLNGTLEPEGTDFDILSVTGARYEATTLTFNDVTISGGSGLLLELVNKTFSGAVLSAIEITAANPSGVANPTVDVQLSRDGGLSFTETIASNVPAGPFWTRFLGLDRQQSRNGSGADPNLSQ